ncbi:hypothetical protein C465_02156 [Halorubrum distributum JCM 9100]|uniref:Uncharacterized protein n=2 Tax=Halorubrum distributum TaxID=29283 RepID=M0EZ98_9EURY|nr:hypothetical protein C465_02156 [Halorubrum distributum JCM 9100]ELZ58985.1 hypothetical protein C466_00250 [Halorubrum distributum JCM 10118]
MDLEIPEPIFPRSRTDRRTTAEGKFIEFGLCSCYIDWGLISPSWIHINKISNVIELIFQFLMEAAGDGNELIIKSRPSVFGIILTVKDILRAFEQHVE